MNLADPTGMTLLLPEATESQSSMATPADRLPALHIELTKDQVIDLIMTAARESRPRAIAFLELIQLFTQSLPVEPFPGIVPFEQIPPKIRKKYPDFTKAGMEQITKQICEELAFRLAAKYKTQGYAYPVQVKVQLEASSGRMLATTDLTQYQLTPTEGVEQVVILTSTVTLSQRAPTPPTAPQTLQNITPAVSVNPEILEWLKANKPLEPDGALSLTVADHHRVCMCLASTDKLTQSEALAFFTHVVTLAGLRNEDRYPKILAHITDVSAFNIAKWVDHHLELLERMTDVCFQPAHKLSSRDYVVGMQAYLAVYTTALAYAINTWDTVQLIVVCNGTSVVPNEIYRISRDPELPKETHGTEELPN